ncbi:MAG: hypothetical protein HYW50_03235 [Candidatus Diapherotrites archaeon]|nr:hypothetical protein [Candidatus Diapherotrites archaeon]
MEKKFFLTSAIAFFFFVSGCTTQAPPPEDTFNPPDLSPQDTKLFEPPEPDFPPVPPPAKLIDECEWTLDIENFQFERNPTGAQAREYNTCYNDKYILKVNSGSSADFCKPIADDKFLVDCFSTLARKTGNLNACSSAPNKTVSISEFNQDIQAADACYYQYLVTYNQQMNDEDETALCNSISNAGFKEYCISRMEYLRSR